MLRRQDTEELNMTRNEFLYELEKETLNELRHYLCNHLQPEKLLPWLQSKKVLTTDHTEIIASNTTTNSKVNCLVDFILKSGPGCLDLLKRAIKRSNKTQNFIADKLTLRFEEVQNREQNKVKLHFMSSSHSPPPPYMESLPSSFSVPNTAYSPSIAKEIYNSVQPRRPPVTNEWPSCNKNKVETSSNNSTFEANLRERSYFASKDFQTLTNSEPSLMNTDHISIQAEKLSLYKPFQQQPTTSSPTRAWIDSEYRGSGSSTTMQHIEQEQDIEFEKIQAKMQHNRESGSCKSIRQPDEHDVRESGKSISPRNILFPQTRNTEQLVPLSDSYNLLYPPSQDFESFEISVDD